MDDDDFFDDDDVSEAAVSQSKHIMLIVDDEPGVHEVTRLALRPLQFDGRGLELLSAYSGQEGRDLLSERNDIAVILLDVVMESETAGLDLVRTIRRDLGNTDVRIILRTGQPGQAPEETVIVEYDINDYKAKSELTRSHLTTSVISALRGWRDIQDLHQLPASGLFPGRPPKRCYRGRAQSDRLTCGGAGYRGGGDCRQPRAGGLGRRDRG